MKIAYSQQKANKDNQAMMKHAHVCPQMNPQLAGLFLEEKNKRGGVNGPGRLLIKRQAHE